MTTIRTTCPGCGEVDMTPADVFLVLRGDDDSAYRFLCPACDGLVEKPADRNVVALLTSAGVRVTDELDDLRPALVEAVRHAPASLPPLREEDVARFAELLQDDRFLQRLATGS